MLIGHTTQVARTCLITGGSSGIGAATARMLSRDGNRVALIGRDLRTLEAMRQQLEGPALGVRADLSDPLQLDSAIGQVEAAWGSVEVLVCSAGASLAATIMSTSDEDWARLLEINLTSPFRLMRRALPRMVDDGWGRVVMIASVVAKRGEAQVAAYAATKHGLLGLVRAAAAELARTGVTVNAICPGYTDTPMTDATVAAIAARSTLSADEARAALARRQPIGRLVDPVEVAEAVRFCLVNGAVTGQGINVDGGAVQS